MIDVAGHSIGKLSFERWLCAQNRVPRDTVSVIRQDPSNSRTTIEDPLGCQATQNMALALRK